VIIAFDREPLSLDGLSLRSRHTYAVSVGPEVERVWVHVLGGLFRREVELRQAVTAGDLLGTLLDLRDGSSRVETCAHRSPRSLEGIGSMPACGLGIGS
jgi:hypothetical protein